MSLIVEIMYFLIASAASVLLIIYLYRKVRNYQSFKNSNNDFIEQSYQRCRVGFEKNRLKYDVLRERTSPDPDTPFWDIVVITASDKMQCETYEIQIQEKIRNKLIPSFCMYRIYPDPEGVKIGSGGATMRVLYQLRAEFGWEELRKKRIMLVHAGGYSQRLPSLTAIGKLSISFPIGSGNELYQVLEGLMVSFYSFPMKMRSGVMLCACDIMFMFADESDWRLDCDGFVTLGNVVTVEEGVGHGVLDFEGMPEVWREHCLGGSQVYLRNCHRFLHKYSADTLRTTGVVHSNVGNEFVYQDSSYFMSWEAAGKILAFYDANQPIQCEIDAYGDFLKAAAAPNDDYIYDTGNVVQSTPQLIQTRKAVYDLCKSLSLRALVFNTGKYLHFGTSKEYIEYATDLSGNLLSESNELFVGKSINKPFPYFNSVRVMASFLDNSSSLSIGRGSILEYCLVECDVRIGNNCFISHCHLPADTDVPNSTYMFTVVIRDEGKAGYVTPVFGINDNLKKTSSLAQIRSITYQCTDLEVVYSKYKAEGYTVFSNQEHVSLWNARIFPISSSPTDSVKSAIYSMSALSAAQSLLASKYVSMEDIVLLKDTRACFEFETLIRDRIHSQL